MEYKIVKDISIYYLIRAGASKGFTLEFEQKSGLRTVEILTGNLAWFWCWVEENGYTQWFVDKGFIEEDWGSVYRVGDRFEISLSSAFIVKGGIVGNGVGALDKVLLITLGNSVTLVSLISGQTIGYECKFEANGTISKQSMVEMVVAGYGDVALYKKEI